MQVMSPGKKQVSVVSTPLRWTLSGSHLPTTVTGLVQRYAQTHGHVPADGPQDRPCFGAPRRLAYVSLALGLTQPVRLRESFSLQSRHRPERRKRPALVLPQKAFGSLCQEMASADLSQLSSASFNTAGWINSCLQDKPEEEALEAYLAALAMKLHILSQDYTDQLETGMVEAMSTMPRVLTEVSRIEEILRNVDGEMGNLALQLRTFDQRNVAGVEDLSRLDTLKGNMEKCKATLEEHARWSQLVREAKAFLEGGGRLSDSADRIATMCWSLQVLQNMPGHEERRETCDKLSDLLLSALRPRVKRDIQENNAAALHEYLYVYDKLGQRAELEEEYIRGKVEARLGGVWLKYSVVNFPLAPFFAAYLAKLAQLLGDEAGSLSALFGPDRAVDLASAMLESALEFGSDASLASRLADSASPETTLAAYQAADEFAKKALKYLSDSDSGAQTKSFRPALLERSLQAIYAGFLQHGAQNAAEAEGLLVRTKLAEAASLASFDSACVDSALGDDGEEQLFAGGLEESPTEACAQFGERLIAAAEAVLEPVEASLQRTEALLGGFHAKASLRAVAAALGAFAKQLGSKVEELRVACGLPHESGGGGEANSSSSSSSSIPTSTSMALAESWARRLELHDVAAGRMLVPCALRALQASGRLSRHVRSLESVAAGMLQELSTSLFLPEHAAIDKAIAAVVGGSASGSVGAAYAACLLQQDPSAASELRSFFSTAGTVFASVSSPLSRLKGAAGALFFDICVLAPEKMLAELAGEDVWSSEVAVSVDSLLPQQAVTQAGEHLLSLVQELELFASSDALPDLLHLSGEAPALAVASRGWRRMRTTLELREDDGIDSLCKRPACTAAITVAEKVMFGSVLSRLDDLEGGGLSPLEDPAADDAAAVGFVNEWLGAVADATMGLLFGQIVQIRRLSVTGCAQLVVDLEYVSNVIGAMGLRQHPLLLHLQQLLTCDPQGLQAMVDNMPGNFRRPATAT